MNSPSCYGLPVAFLVALVMSGCHFGEHCKDIPPGAIPQPVGTYVCQWQHEQMNRAEADDFVIYHYEWLRETNQFSPFGGQHVVRIAKRLPYEPFSVVIEPSHDSGLDQARVSAVVELLAEQGLPDAHQRVKVGTPIGEGLYGQEAPNATSTLFGNQRGGRGGGNFGFGGGQGGLGGGFGGGSRGGLGGGFGSF